MTNPHIEYIHSFLQSKGYTALQLNREDIVNELMDKALYEQKPLSVRNELREHLAAEYRKAIPVVLIEQARYIPHPDLPPVSSLYENPPEHMDIAITYFIWQVKRKMLDLFVSDPIFLIFFNPTQASFKSSLVKRILGLGGHSKESIINPIFIGTTTLNALSDERSTPALASKPVLFFDELEGAAKADRERLKTWVTGDIIDYRKLGTNMTLSCKIKSTCIATTNKSVVKILADITGMRRYWELVIDRPNDVVAYDNYNWKYLWESVNPHAEHPGIELIKNQVHRVDIEHPLDQFLSESIVDTMIYRSQELHEDFIKFCKLNNYKDLLNIREFTTELTNRGWAKKRKNNGWNWFPPCDTGATNETL